MPITSGSYRIVNFRFDVPIALFDKGDGTPVESTLDEALDGQVWTVTALRNNRFTIQNFHHDNHANVGNRAEAGSTVEGRTAVQYWIIADIRGNGRYTIAASDTRRFWSLESGDDGTAVTVVDLATSANTQWNFEPVASGTIGGPNALPCSALSRRPGVSTQHLRLVSRSHVETLPHAIRHIRDANVSPTDVNATDQLQLIATLRNSVCNMPPVITSNGNFSFWDQYPQFHSTSSGWPFIWMLISLIDLASMIPGPSSIDFSRAPSVRVEVRDHAGDIVDTSQWHAGTHCIAVYCLYIIRALPEHRCG